jgi:hypothetical protein
MPSENQKDNVDLLILKNCEPSHGLFTKYVKRYTIAGEATKEKQRDPCQFGSRSTSPRVQGHCPWILRTTAYDIEDRPM